VTKLEEEGALDAAQAGAPLFDYSFQNIIHSAHMVQCTVSEVKWIDRSCGNSVPPSLLYVVGDDACHVVCNLSQGIADWTSTTTLYDLINMLNDEDDVDSDDEDEYDDPVEDSMDDDEDHIQDGDDDEEGSNDVDDVTGEEEL